MTYKLDFEIFPWDSTFETEIEQIDEQHRILVKLLNKLANTLTQDEVCEIEETFKELAKYADFHFKSEEKVWEQYIQESDLVNSHKHSHDSFLPKVLKIKEKNKDKKLHVVIEEILLFLIRWLAFHIIDEDKRLALIIQSLNSGKNISEAKYITDEVMSGSMKNLIDTILKMYDNLSLKAISLIRERKARLKAEKELRVINAELEKLSITDQLTNLYNRRYFDEIFEREINKAIRNETSISLMIFDIDYFKKLNDNYGHLKGDEALIKVATCISTLCKRANDFVFRIGGEEFAILITNDEEESCQTIAKFLQKSIGDLKIPNEKSSISQYLTISGGLLTKVPSIDDSMDSFIQIADERLYIAKKEGRNRIVDN